MPFQAQETRASQIEEQQAQKSQQLRRYEPSKVEEVIEFLHDWLLDQPSGVYPSFDSIYSVRSNIEWQPQFGSANLVLWNVVKK